MILLDWSILRAASIRRLVQFSQFSQFSPAVKVICCQSTGMVAKYSKFPRNRKQFLKNLVFYFTCLGELTTYSVGSCVWRVMVRYRTLQRIRVLSLHGYKQRYRTYTFIAVKVVVNDRAISLIRE